MIKRLAKAASVSPLIWPALAFAFLLVGNLLANPGFFEVVFKNGHLYGSLVDIFSRSAPLLLTSLGMTLVIATGGVDLSVGASAAIAASIVAIGIEKNWGLPSSLLAAAISVLALGCWNGFLVVRLGLQPIIATLIAMVAGRGIAQLLLDGQIANVDHPGFSFIGGGYLAGLPFSILIALVALIVGSLFLRKTAAGLFLESVGSSSTASRLAGVPVDFVTILAYALCALGAGVAGWISSSNIRAVDVNNLGLYLELDAILAVVIGGTRLTGGRFSLMGSALGALIIQTVSTTIHTQGIRVEFMLVVKASVVIVICLLQSERLRALLRLQKAAS